jgi:hypothetical protein
MHAWIGLAATLVALAMAPTAWGCTQRDRPGPDTDYKTIFLAEVVGVHLTGYAHGRLQELRGGEAVRIDGNFEYEVDLIAYETFKGKTPSTLSLRLGSGGCGPGIVGLTQFVIFYVREDGSAAPVPQDDDDYQERLKKFGSRYTAPCASEVERRLSHPCWKSPN